MVIGHCGARQMLAGGCHDPSSIFLALPDSPRGDHNCGHDRDSGAVELFDSVAAVVGGEMPAAGWMRKWRGGGGAGDRARAPILAAHELDCEAAQERLEAEMTGLVDSIESGVLVLDAGGRILRASDRLAAIFGLEPRRLLELGAIGPLIDSLSYHFLRPAETTARWRDHVRRGDEA